MNPNIKLTATETVVTIAAPECEIRIPTDELYAAMKPIFAKRHLRSVLEGKGTSAATINALMEGETISQRWINAIENNESILECTSLAVDLLIHDLGKDGDKHEAA